LASSLKLLLYISIIACICAGVGTTAWFDIPSLEIYI